MARDDRPLGPVALLEFLAGAAGARIIAAHFLLPTHDLLHWLHVAGSSHTRLFEFAPFAAHECFF